MNQANNNNMSLFKSFAANSSTLQHREAATMAFIQTSPYKVSHAHSLSLISYLSLFTIRFWLSHLVSEKVFEKVNENSECLYKRLGLCVLIFCLIFLRFSRQANKGSFKCFWTAFSDFMILIFIIRFLIALIIWERRACCEIVEEFW